MRFLCVSALLLGLSVADAFPAPPGDLPVASEALASAVPSGADVLKSPDARLDALAALPDAILEGQRASTACNCSQAHDAPALPALVLSLRADALPEDRPSEQLAEASIRLDDDASLAALLVSCRTAVVSNRRPRGVVAPKRPLPRIFLAVRQRIAHATA